MRIFDLKTVPYKFNENKKNLCDSFFLIIVNCILH